LTVALKERFPDAEVWGIDAGAPMLRYGHMRAVRLGVGVNFSQRMAEDTQFPDNHFDLVTSYLLHHEVPADVTLKIIAEVQRVTRPGGVYYPLDFVSGGTAGTTSPGRSSTTRCRSRRKSVVAASRWSTTHRL